MSADRAGGSKVLKLKGNPGPVLLTKDTVNSTEGGLLHILTWLAEHSRPLSGGLFQLVEVAGQGVAEVVSAVPLGVLALLEKRRHEAHPSKEQDPRKVGETTVKTPNGCALLAWKATSKYLERKVGNLPLTRSSQK